MAFRPVRAVIDAMQLMLSLLAFRAMGVDERDNEGSGSRS